MDREKLIEIILKSKLNYWACNGILHSLKTQEEKTEENNHCRRLRSCQENLIRAILDEIQAEKADYMEEIKLRKSDFNDPESCPLCNFAFNIPKEFIGKKVKVSIKEIKE